MDPNACLIAILEAFRDGDRDASLEALQSLQQWIVRGGFLPSASDVDSYANHGTWKIG